MSESWDFYLCRMSGRLAAVCLDLAQVESAPDPHRPWLLYAWIPLAEPGRDGLGTPEEYEGLRDLEEALREAVVGELGARHVGRVTTRGRRELYFYAASPKGFEELVDAILVVSGFRGVVDLGCHEDPEWAHYLKVMYPSAEELACMRNRALCIALREHGDSLVTPRAVRHRAWFPDTHARDAFASEVDACGYEVESRWEVPPEQADGHPYGVCVRRSHSVEPGTIDEVVLDLARRAHRVGGDYDGWETHVVPDASLPEA